MTELNRFRDAIRRFISNFEKPILWIFRGGFSFWMLYLIRTYFGYSAALEDPRLGIAIAMICAFVPWSFGALILLIVLMLELYSLSPIVALIALIFAVLGYLLCAFYGSKHVHNIAFIPPSYPSQFSFAMPMVSALFGSVNEITSVLCGGVFAFFLATIRKNSTMFIDSQAVSIPDLLMQTMFGNRLLYYYLAALSAMFLVTWVLRTRKIPHAWLIAILAGVASETAIMAVGYNATGNSSRVSGLLTMNLLLAAIGIIINFFVRGLDYARIEDLQFEDDDYVYYVRAVPKIHFVEEEKRVKRITGEPDDEETAAAGRGSSSVTPRKKPAAKKTAASGTSKSGMSSGIVRGDQPSAGAASARGAQTARKTASSDAARPGQGAQQTLSAGSSRPPQTGASAGTARPGQVTQAAPAAGVSRTAQTGASAGAARTGQGTRRTPAAGASRMTQPEVSAGAARTGQGAQRTSAAGSSRPVQAGTSRPAQTGTSAGSARTGQPAQRTPAAAHAASRTPGTSAADSRRPAGTSAGGGDAAASAAAKRTTAKKEASDPKTATRTPRRTLTPEERAARREAQEGRTARSAAGSGTPRMQPIDDLTADETSKGENRG